MAMAKDYGKLWKGVTKATNEAEAVLALTQIVFDKQGRAFASSLTPKEAELCVETLDCGITQQHLKPAEKNAFFLMLRRLAERHGLLPDRMMIREPIEVSEEIFAAGGFGDVRSGTYNGGLVAVKTTRVAARDDLQKIKKRFYKEVILWETLSHPNILELVGVQEDIKKRQFVTVSEWMKNGNIMDYIKKNHTNRLDLLHGASKGLKYLHDANLTHGDLKGANILVSNDVPPRACLADFGFITTVLCPGQLISESAKIEGGTTPFTAPELLVPQEYNKTEATPTTQGDVYAFGLVIFQVLTGELPFSGIAYTALVYAIVQGKRPEKPKNAPAIGLSDPLWNFVQRCWSADAQLRPGVGEVVAQVGKAAVNWGGLMPPCPVAEDVDSYVGETDSKKFFALFQPAPGTVSASLIDSGSTSELFTSSSTSSTQLSELTTKESQEVITGLLRQTHLDAPVAVEPRSEEPSDVGLSAAVVSPQTDTPHNHPPAPPPQEKQKEQKGFRIPKLRELLNLGR